MLENKYNREIRSFVLRQGKITAGQKKAIDELMPGLGVKYTNGKLNLGEVFKSNNPVVIEIGFGMGDATWQIAKNNPDKNYLAVEVHSPGVGALLIAIKEHGIKNIRVIQHDAIEVLRDMVDCNSIAGFHIYFPDPWHKKRHNKRRIIQSNFIDLLAEKLVQGGYIHLATDWEDYADWMLDVLSKKSYLENFSGDKRFISRPDDRPLTKFEQRGIGLGHKVWDLMFRKIIAN